MSSFIPASCAGSTYGAGSPQKSTAAVADAPAPAAIIAHVGAEVLLVALGDDEVEPERPVGQRPGALGLGTDVARVIPARAEDSEPARVRDRAHELGPGAPSEPDRQDRVLHAQQIAERRAHLRRGVTVAHDDITVPNVSRTGGGDPRQRPF